ncbi:MAG: formate acetyltransferase [Deltaproteobacteria bacterium]|jgi:formate C-acetyltransferase|nr:formate acetyltransferase [Deltaproteobacteria bacterium]MBW2531937.1 formate acetyltransferase [Deltaproteobacteria bacterium]
MSSALALRDLLLDQITPTMVVAKLRAMAAMLELKPSLRHHLRDLDPIAGSHAFTATIEFVTWDGRTGAHARFANGKMQVCSGPAQRADLTVRFRAREQMRAFFAGADAFDMVLDNTLQFEGNLSYLLKFGHMSQALTLGGRKLAPGKPWGAGRPPSPADMPAPPPGEPSNAIAAGEVTYLDEPHLARYTLDDFPRIKRLLWKFRTTQPAICTERAQLVTEHALRHRRAGRRDVPPVLRQAEALDHLLRHKEPIIRHDDLLAGTVTREPIGIPMFPELGGVGIWPELLTMEARQLNPYRIRDEQIEILNRRVFPFWMDDNVREWTKRHAADPTPLELDERFVLYFMWKTQAITHTVVDVPRFLERGLLDIRAEAAAREDRAEDERGRAFYRALGLALDGCLHYADHLAAEADRQAAHEPNAERRARLRELGRICRKVPRHPPDTLHEALQAIWILFVAQHNENMGAGLVLGRLDAWLQPYFERDMAAAADEPARAHTIERALELCAALMLKATDHLPMVPDVGNRLFGGSSENQVITLGGTTADGANAVCDMTWIFLKATEMLRLRDPNVNARYAPGVNSEAYLWRLCEVNALTRATPSLHNDDAVVPALVAQGFAPEDARDWTAIGCVEPTSCGRHFGHTNCMMLNLVAPLEMALHDGSHPVLGSQVGPRTGDPASFADYESFWKAYCHQLGWVIDRAVEANNMLGRAHQVLKPTPLLSALFDGPMQSGKDVTEGGARYNTSGTAMVGLTDVVDSLAAIKVLVFERKRLSLAELVRALRADFVGHEPLAAELARKVPKFGRGDELTASIAAEVQAFVAARFAAAPHYRGGTYLPGYWSMSNHVAFGLLSGALPSGRRKGKPFTPGLTPSATAGASLTAQLRSVAGLEAEHMPNNIAFNVKVVPGADDSHRAVVDRMTAFAAAYFELGGMQMQFNVTSTETLRAAMAEPDAHRDLLVRISGYNAYFVELNRDIQLELIERMEHALAG